jgi:hypothetical protein
MYLDSPFEILGSYARYVLDLSPAAKSVSSRRICGCKNHEGPVTSEQSRRDHERDMVTPHIEARML